MEATVLNYISIIFFLVAKNPGENSEGSAQESNKSLFSGDRHQGSGRKVVLILVFQNRQTGLSKIVKNKGS